MKLEFVTLIVVALLLYGCAGQQAQVQPAGGAAVQPTPSTGNGSPGNQAGEGTQPAAKEFTVEATEWQFSPDTITVNKGDRVKITLVNKDVAHGIAIPDFGFTLVANAGQTATGEFTASKEGNYTFFCNVFCGDGHRGMKGTLVVK